MKDNNNKRILLILGLFKSKDFRFLEEKKFLLEEKFNFLLNFIFGIFMRKFFLNFEIFFEKSFQLKDKKIGRSFNEISKHLLFPNNTFFQFCLYPFDFTKILFRVFLFQRNLKKKIRIFIFSGFFSLILKNLSYFFFHFSINFKKKLIFFFFFFQKHKKKKNLLKIKKEKKKNIKYSFF